MTERETEVGSTFCFISCHFCLHVVFQNKRCQRQTGVFYYVSFCAEFCCAMLRDAVCVRSAEQSERSLILSRE